MEQVVMERAQKSNEMLREVVAASLELHPLLEGLPPEAKQRLLEWGELQRYAPGSYLSREGDPANAYWFLCQGSVRVFYRSPQGFEVTVKLFGAPAAWAEMELLNSSPHIEDCVAVDHASVLRLPKDRFIQFMDAYPRFTRNVLLDTSARFLIAAQNEKALAFLQVPQRLAHLLLAYVRVYGVPVEGGIGIRIKLSQNELANGIGSSRKSITRLLAVWQKEGLMSRRRGTYVVHDVAGLAAQAASDLVGVDWVAGSSIELSRGTNPRPLSNWSARVAERRKKLPPVSKATRTG